MDQIDLYDMRKKLHAYKKIGKKQVISILNQLEDPKIDQKALAESKIHKTVKKLTQIEIIGDSVFSEQDLKQIQEKATETLQKLKKNQKSIPQEKVTLISVTTDRKQSIDVPNQNPINQNQFMNQLGLPQDLDQIRLKVLQNIIQRFTNETTPQQEVITFCKKLENEIRMKFKDKHSQYQTAIKEILKYLQNDKDGSVRNRLLTGLIDIPTAAQLRSEDWTSATRLSIAGGVGREILSANDMNHNKYIAQVINKDVALALCNNCGQKQMKLVNEIQTRASDEPSTKFYECLNCGIGETTNG
ncbi:unnamed protein product [Paramecium pentaurelia]|uniref:Uncharacterized protein n=1 Tax=Paramecium pentaurelia TaxID=43138 RepID=A0A8S1UQG6_9CILI|nr:unnamed protein product [Paramecium pentaurelia]